MRVVPEGLLRRLRAQDAIIATCWAVTLDDGTQVGFTSHDEPIVYNGLTHNPANGMSADATQQKGDFSSSNGSSKIIYSVEVDETDVRGGRWDGATVEFFWIDPENPELGIVQLQSGFLGEITTDQVNFTVELRSQLDLLSQPFGHLYNLECDAQLGDSRCGVHTNPETWLASTTYVANVAGDARIGNFTKPTVDNGFWYQCVGGTVSTPVSFDKGVTYAGLGPDPFTNLNAGRSSSPFGTNWYSWLFAQFFEVSLTSYNPPGTPNFVTITLHGGKSGATEPTWPTVLGETVTDGQLTWKAVLPKIANGTVSATINRMQFVDSSRVEPASTFQYGWLKWTSGANAGRQVEVQQYVLGPPPTITLLEVMNFPIQAGDEYMISWGCSKTRASCKNIYDNMLNMRGFPDMPTEDRALQTPNFSTANSDFTFTPTSSGKKG